jgi:hypothetical protein
MAESRILLKGQQLPVLSDFDEMETAGLNVNSLLIAAGAVPREMVTGPATLTNAFAGTTTVSAGRLPPDTIMISLRGVPPSVCSRLIATSGSGSTGAFGNTTNVASGQLLYSVTQDLVPSGFIGVAVNPARAGVSCNYGSQAHLNAGMGGTPTTPKLTGNVNVYMYFMIDA